jgi:methylmalonyl-CoA/ethylmalonyl-CoA epimerase
MTPAPIFDNGSLVFHHVGLACTDIEQEATRLSILGYRTEGVPFVDPVQGVRGMFVGGQAPRLELLEPHGSAGVLKPWLEGGIKLYHLAYEAADLNVSLAALCENRGRLVVPPTPAVAFDGRAIAFVMLPNRLLVELIQRCRHQS